MNMSRTLTSLTIGVPCLLQAAELPSQPNIIFILTDDQGYGDLSCTGNPILKTPNMDRLHDEGVRFSDFHVSPTCSPTRSALMTGRYPFKNGVTHTIYERERLTLDATTIAQVLQSAGYATGIFGKWHLGDEDAYQPDQRGFDEVFIHGAGGIGQSYPGSCGDVPGNMYFDPIIKHNGRFEKTSGYCTDVFFAQAMQWIASQKGKKPFFCYLPTNAPHVPLQVRQEDEARYKGKVPDDTAKFFGMIANIDDNIGQVLAKLEELGLENNTLIVFMTDNGTAGGRRVFNAGMRGAKGSVSQGGTRAASFWRWPGTLKSADVKPLTAHIDVFATLAELAGAPLSEAVRQQVEGLSLVPLLLNPDAAWPDRMLVTHGGRWPKGDPPRKSRSWRVRNSRYCLVSRDDLKLYDLQSDPRESRDVAGEHPEIVREFVAAYDKWWDEVVPLLVNEDAWKTAPAVNPFREQYEKHPL